MHLIYNSFCKILFDYLDYKLKLSYYKIFVRCSQCGHTGFFSLQKTCNIFHNVDV